MEIKFEYNVAVLCIVNYPKCTYLTEKLQLLIS